MKRSKQDKGFTLVELLIVIVILGILATVTVFAVTGITTRGKDSACKSDMKVIQVAEEANNANTGSYDTLANLKANGLIHASPDQLHGRCGCRHRCCSFVHRDGRHRNGLRWPHRLIQPLTDSKRAGPSGPALSRSSREVPSASRTA